jgi:meso-butanediol dehydrogenase / (S,S)-butanediol dehydrogenase / diacetyl reductase
VSARRGVIILGASAIGTAIGSAFAEAGDVPFCIARDRPAAGVFAGWSQADCAEPDAARRAVGEAVAALPGLHVLVLAAASMPVASAADTSDEQWNQALRDSLTSAFNLVRECLPQLEAGGCIVAVGSVNSFLSAPGLAAYAAAKAGLDGLIRQVALDYGGLGIRANIVAPGLVSAGESGAVANGYPAGRVGRPRDVADAVVFLASDRASFITGVTLPVDGGLSIASPAAYLSDRLRARFPQRPAGQPHEGGHR